MAAICPEGLNDPCQGLLSTYLIEIIVVYGMWPQSSRSLKTLPSRLRTPETSNMSVLETSWASVVRPLEHTAVWAPLSLTMQNALPLTRLSASTAGCYGLDFELKLRVLNVRGVGSLCFVREGSDP